MRPIPLRPSSRVAALACALLIGLAALSGCKADQRPIAAPSAYVGSERSDKYHLERCQWARRIKHRVTFATPEEAHAAGYVPCKVCKPPRAAGTLPRGAASEEELQRFLREHRGR